jgi:hypothetical protein
MRFTKDKIDVLWLLTICSLLLAPLASHAQNKPITPVQENLTRAEELYYEGSFNEAITLVNECLLRKDIQQGEQKSAYKLLANIRLSQSNKEAAETCIRKLLAIDAIYAPTIEQETPQFVNLVKEVKTKIKQEQKKKKTWLWIGAGATAAAVATYFIIRNNDNGSRPPTEERPLALPPDWPD